MHLETEAWHRTTAFSFNGKTSDSESEDVGSIPTRAAQLEMIMIQFRVRNNIVTTQVVEGSGFGIGCGREQVIVPNKIFIVPGRKEFSMNFFKKYFVCVSIFKRLEMSVCVLEK